LRSILILIIPSTRRYQAVSSNIFDQNFVFISHVLSREEAAVKDDVSTRNINNFRSLLHIVMVIIWMGWTCSTYGSDKDWFENVKGKTVWETSFRTHMLCTGPAYVLILKTRSSGKN
jgi:hypothetical protein